MINLCFASEIPWFAPKVPISPIRNGGAGGGKAKSGRGLYQDVFCSQIAAPGVHDAPIPKESISNGVSHPHPL